MLGFPPIPPFEGMHPIVVHFPIGILLIAWLPMLIGLFDKGRRGGWFASAALLLVVGTLAAFGAVLTGEATEEIVVATSDSMKHAIHEHEDAAELARNLFIGVTVLFLVVWVAASRIAEKKRAMVGMIGGALVAVVYGLGALALANTGHLGGVLVHEYGIHAPLGAADMPAAPHDAEDDDD